MTGTNVDSTFLSDDSYANNVLRTALDIGVGMLQCGGEIDRVEDTVERICRAYGAKHVEVFCVTTALIASVRMRDGTYSSQTRRISRSYINLYKLELLNAVSRKICAELTDIETVQKMIKEAKHTRPYPSWVVYLGGVLAAGGFAVYFGGTVLDGVASAIIGVILTILMEHIPKKLNEVASTVVFSVAAGLMSALLVLFGIGSSTDKVVIGTIMILIPGLSIGTALKDLLYGDTISGTMRLVQAVIIAAAIAFGYAIAMFVMGGVWK